MSEKQVPISALVETKGVLYFARMLNKIRLHGEGKLREDFHENLGSGLDGFLCEYLRVGYGALRDRTLQGGSDEELLAWAQKEGRVLEAIDIRVWNNFVKKAGWNDEMSERFNFRKEEAGLQVRDDVQTFVDLMEIDEGRRS